MKLTDLTSATLADLRKTRPFPAVSLLMPTHRTEPDNAQDPIRLRNMVTEAKRRLESDPDVPRDARFDVAAQLDQALGEVDLVHSLDGLVILASPGEHEVWSLPREVPERVVFSDTYLTRNLVAARAQNEPYWVLALAIDHATLWGGTNDRVEQVSLEGFPHKIDDLDWDVEHQERVGNFPSVYTDERTHQFMREIDTKLNALLSRHPRPFYLVGLPPVLAVLDEVRTNHHTEAGRVPKGGLTQGPPHTLAAEIEPAREAYRTKQIGDLAQRIDAATGRRAMTSGLDEVWRAVLEGRVDTLVIEDGYRETVQVAENHLMPVPDGTPSNGFPVVDDIVDDIAERALDRGAQVYFVPDGELAERGHIAATLRF